MSVLKYLSVELDLHVDNFINGMRSAAKEAKELEKSIKPVTQAAKEWGEAFSVVGDVVALGMAEATLKTAEYGAELEHLHVRSGLAVEDAAKLGYAATLNGSSMEGLGNATKFLLKNMELAEQGSKKQIMAFAALGISEKDLAATGGDTAKAFALIADRTKEMADPTAHAADFAAILGKNWTELLPTLMLGSEGLKEAGDAAERAGVVMSGEAAKAAKEFEEGMKDLKASAMGVGIAIGTALMPVLKEAVDIARAGAKDIAAFAKEHDNLTKAIFGTATAIGGVGGLLLGLSGVLKVLPMIKDATLLLTGGLGSLATAMGLVTASALAAAVAGGAIVVAFTAVVGILVASKSAMDAWNESAQHTDELSGRLQKLHDQIVAAGGPDIKNTTNNLGDWSVALTAAARNIKNLDPALAAHVKAQNDAAAAVKKHAKELQDQALAAEAAKKKYEELQNAINGMLDAFDGEIKRGPALTGVLEILLNRHAPIQEIVAKLGKQTHEYVQALEAEGKAINPVLRYVDDMYIKTKQLNEADAKQFDFAVLLGKTWEQNAVNLQTWLQAGADSSAKLKLINDNYEETLKKTLALENEAYKTIYGDDLKAKIDSIDEKLAADTNYRDYARDVALALLVTQEQADAALTAYHDIQVQLRLARDRDAKQEEIDILIQQGKDALQVYDVYTKEHDKIQKESTKRNAEENKKAVEDVKRSAGKIFDDMFLSGQNVFTSLKNALKGGALSIGRSIFEDVVGELGGPIKRAFDDFFQGLLEGSGFKAFLQGLGDRIGGRLGNILGGNNGAILNAAPIGPRGSSVPTAPPTTGGGGGSIGSTVGTLGTLSNVANIGSFVSDVIGNFQNARMEGTLNAVEYNTRASMIHLYFILTDTTAHIRDTMFEVKDLAVEIAQDLGEILDGVNKTFNLLAARPGLAAPALAGSGPAPVFNLYISAPLNQAEINQSFTEEVDRRTVRDEISPELLDFWNTGGDNALQKLIAMLKAAWNGSVSSRV
jgi:hypothetical protein